MKNTRYKRFSNYNIKIYIIIYYKIIKYYGIINNITNYRIRFNTNIK